MIGRDRSTADVIPDLIASSFDALLYRVVAGSTGRGQITLKELHRIALMTMDVMGNGRLNHQALGLASLAQWLLVKLGLAKPAPSGRLVECSPRLVLAPARVALAIASQLLDRLTQPASRKVQCPHDP